MQLEDVANNVIYLCGVFTKMPPSGFNLRSILRVDVQSEPTRGEKLAEKYERRFNRYFAARNYSLALDVAHDIARKLEAAAEDFASGGDALVLLHRYDQGFKVIPYAKDLPRRNAALPVQKAAPFLRHTTWNETTFLAGLIGKWGEGLKFGPPSDSISSMLHTDRTFARRDGNPSGFARMAPNGAANDKWAPFAKPRALVEYQNALVEY